MAPRPRLALQCDLATGLVDDGVHGREPEPGALGARLRREEGLEHPRRGVGIHAVARVGDGEGHSGSAVFQLARFGGDGERAAVGHRVAGVHDEVEQHLLELARVHDHGPDRGRTQVDLDVRADEATQDLAERDHGVVRVEHDRLHHAAPAQREQLVDEGARLLAGAAHGLEITAGRVLRREPVQHQLAVAEDHREQVVEVVRDATREPAERLEPLRLLQLALDAPPLRDVVEDDDDVIAIVIGAGRQPRRPHGELEVTAVGRLHRHVVADEPLAAQHPGDGRAEHLARCLGRGRPRRRCP